MPAILTPQSSEEIAAQQNADEAEQNLEAQAQGETQENVQQDDPEADETGNNASESESDGPTLNKFSDIQKLRNGETLKPSEEKKEVKSGSESNDDEFEKVVSAPADKLKRDYTGIEEADQKWFKNMNNEAFNKTKALYLENKQLKATPKVENKNGLPSSYYSHPEAYTLDKSYREVVQTANLADAIRDHWKDQELSLRTDGKWRKLIDDGKGNFTVGEEEEGSPEAEKVVYNALKFAERQSDKYRASVENFSNVHKQKYEEGINFIKGSIEKFFPGYLDEKHPTHELQSKIVDAFPETWRDHPTMDLIKCLGAANALLVNENKSLKEGKKTKESIKTDAKNAQPGKNNFIAGNKNGGAINSFSELKRLRDQVRANGR